MYLRHENKDSVFNKNVMSISGENKTVRARWGGAPNSFRRKIADFMKRQSINILCFQK